jgi:hypothetical protein
MKRIWQFISICLVALVFSSVLSHAAVRWLKIKAEAKGYRVFGSQSGKIAATLYGTSPAFDGLDWSQVADFMGGGIGNWGIPGSSASEWEMMQLSSPNAPQTFIVVSRLDLNDYFLCDFRAEIVPFWKTVRDLREAGAGWSFSRRMLSQYPLTFIRQLFPTAGRSDGVMVGTRILLLKLMGHSSPHDAAGVLRFGPIGPNPIKERLADWDPGRLQRRLALTRNGCQDKEWFDGPRKHALVRMVRQAAAHGKVTIVVMPMSPIYQEELMKPEATREFEQALADAQAAGATSPMIRLDKLPVLEDNGLFWDFFHLNMDGQKIATAAFLKEIKSS